MTVDTWLQFATYFGVLVVLALPLGRYLAWVYEGPTGAVARAVGPVERALYRLARVEPEVEMSWRHYAVAALSFNALGFVALYALLRLQGGLPLNPAALPAVSPEVAFNTAVSFVTNTNWQAYGGETTLSHLSQMLGLTVQNFLSAATGMAVMAALARAFARRGVAHIGNFWVDLTRGTLYVLLPLSAVLALLLVSQGVVQSLDATVDVALVDPLVLEDGTVVAEQEIAVGPAASQVAIKQLGTNGGGFFNVNSAHPLENPSPLANFLEMLAILLLPAAFCFMFGRMVADRRQGVAIFVAMSVIFVPLFSLAVSQEQLGTAMQANLPVDLAPTTLQAGGNMEGKEVRFGITNSALWATATTAASNGSVNSMHDSYTPLGGLVPMWLMQLGEIIYGGVGSGLYGMLAYVVVAVFIAGLMVGRTPEYLGKKIEAAEMKMATLVILVPAAAVLIGTAVAAATDAGTSTLGNPGIHGFSEILYAFSSGANNNGSAFAGLTASGPFYATAIGLAMAFGRYWVIVAVLALAGSLARKDRVPPGAGTLPTHGPLFVTLLVGTVVLVGALTFLPALALGPVVEHLQMIASPMVER